mgnify:FL=1
MEQCQCSSNKLGVHCYECEDEKHEQQMNEHRSGLWWSEVNKKFVKKKMCKKKTSKGVAK